MNAIRRFSFPGGAVHATTLAALAETLRAAEADEACRVLLLEDTAEGVSGRLDTGLCSDLVRMLRGIAQPAVAALRGDWCGDALALVAACDIVHVTEDARFALVDPAHGSVPSGALAEALSRVMTPRALRRYALAGTAFDGREAAANGLATLAFPAQSLAAETAALLAVLTAKDALALRFTRQTLRHVAGMDWDAVLDYNVAKFAELKALQAGQPSARAAAVRSFLAGTSKPGLG